ncbi:hypothetical protein HY065_01730 [Candidatus Berkelbacteria bacterium]|nr:hypothetical protein [Candidatus Berkelbacteria bacterium]
MPEREPFLPPLNDLQRDFLRIRSEMSDESHEIEDRTARDIVEMYGREGVESTVSVLTNIVPSLHPDSKDSPTGWEVRFNVLLQALQEYNEHHQASAIVLRKQPIVDLVEALDAHKTTLFVPGWLALNNKERITEVVRTGKLDPETLGDQLMRLAEHLDPITTSEDDAIELMADIATRSLAWEGSGLPDIP